MERQRRFEQDRLPAPAEYLPGGGDLDQQRSEIDLLLQTADHLFDSLNGLDAHQYLEQNIQTGGQ